VTTSRWPSVYDALLTTFRVVSGLTVFDGPEFGLTADSVGEFVIVGGNGDPDGDPGAITQAWKGLGHNSRDETGEVNCAVIVQTGDTVIKTSRDRAFVLLASLETALLADPTLGAAVTAGWMLPINGTPEQRENSLGSYVRLPFTISYNTRLGAT
jgi:hypothetical protein